MHIIEKDKEEKFVQEYLYAEDFVPLEKEEPEKNEEPKRGIEIIELF